MTRKDSITARNISIYVTEHPRTDSMSGHSLLISTKKYAIHIYSTLTQLDVVDAGINGQEIKLNLLGKIKSPQTVTVQ